MWTLWILLIFLNTKSTFATYPWVPSLPRAPSGQQDMIGKLLFIFSGKKFWLCYLLQKYEVWVCVQTHADYKCPFCTVSFISGSWFPFSLYLLHIIFPSSFVSYISSGVNLIRFDLNSHSLIFDKYVKLLFYTCKLQILFALGKLS